MALVPPRWDELSFSRVWLLNSTDTWRALGGGSDPLPWLQDRRTNAIPWSGLGSLLLDHPLELRGPQDIVCLHAAG